MVIITRDSLLLLADWLQGTDVRGTGHFVYSSMPDFVDSVPLRVTNRMKVWAHDACGARG